MFRPFLIKNTTYPLDGQNIGEAASVARQLTSKHKIPFQAKRTNDNAVFKASFLNGELNTGQLLSWANGNTVIIDELYGVNGSVFTADNDGKKPRIINAGTLEASNGKPCMYFDGSNDALWCSNNSNVDITNQPLYLAVIATMILPAGQVICKNTDASANIQYSLYYNSTQYNFYIEGASDNQVAGTANSVPLNVNHLESAIWTDNVMTIFTNGVKTSNNDTYSGLLTSRNYLTIGARKNAATEATFSKCKISEFHILRGNSKQSSFESKTKKYYSIT